MLSIQATLNKRLFTRLVVFKELNRGATSQVDRSKLPQLIERDLDEHFISGSGPGGQNVNKAVNCCQLKHKPTGIVVKVHQQRSLQENRKIARQLMIRRLDNLYNGQDSVENQEKKLALHRLHTREEQKKLKRLMKEQFKINSMKNESGDSENKSLHLNNKE